MDFGEILAQWEAQEQKRKNNTNSAKRQDGGAWRTKKRGPDSASYDTGNKNSVVIEMHGANSRSRNEQEIWMRQYGVIDKDAEQKEFEEKAQRDTAYLRKLPPEGSIDLHGLTTAQAWQQLDKFIAESKTRGLQKVLIVHGKGNHSTEGPVLAQMTRAFIEQDERLGAHGYSDRSEGGRGSTWVIIR
ncbi:MAG TPA: Smr/MutS family protein [Treponemataceae bacterium]|nr:Smr/MutS family protein [Treponemataceae bacterium]